MPRIARLRDLPPTDLWLGVAAAAATLVYLVARIDVAAHPWEDAAILMRYAGHWAQGFGIAWNPGEPPVDGATDFLFLAVVAALHRAGLTLEHATQVPILFAHAATVGALYLMTRAAGLHRALAGFLAAWVAAGPGVHQVQAFFGTPFFTFLVLLSWWACLRASEMPSWTTAMTFAALALVAALTRPEGVFLAGLMGLAGVARSGWVSGRRLIAALALVFGTLGVAYFLWRWSYFGHPLPNPYYRKGGELFYPGSLVESIRNGIALLMPLLVCLPFAFRNPRARRELIFCAIPVVGFLALWGLLSNEMNYYRRFQTPILPVAIVGFALWMRGLDEDLSLNDWYARLPANLRAAVATSFVLLAGGLIVLQHRALTSANWEDGTFAIAQKLAGLGPDHTMIVSEAGVLPLYSKWRAIDAWGLNDPQIVREGLNEARLDAARPSVVMYRAPFSPLLPPPAEPGMWGERILELHRYTRARNFDLAAVYGHVPWSMFYYYVRSDDPNRDVLLDAIRNTPYPMAGSARPAVDFRDIPQRWQ